MSGIEQAREFWANVARANGWYSEPFFVQVWIDGAGNILDSVSTRALTRDWVIIEGYADCDCLEWQACDICADVVE